MYVLSQPRNLHSLMHGAHPMLEMPQPLLAMKIAQKKRQKKIKRLTLHNGSQAMRIVHYSSVVLWLMLKKKYRRKVILMADM